MRVLALVTARGGSKRIPGKNIRLLGEVPLIVWSIDAAKEVSEICDILVSTDDIAIAEVASSAGALVPWLRPPELATDVSSSVDACLHALNWYESDKGAVDGLLVLQPTSPFRSRTTVQRGIDLFQSNGLLPVVGVSPAESHPMWCFQITDETLRPFVDDVDPNLRSQDLPAAYAVNGAFYLIAPSELRSKRTFISDRTTPLIMNEREERIDIDTEWDWRMAETVLAMRKAGAK